MINKKLAVAALAAVASTVALMGGAQAQGRDQIRIVGSSTVFPFTSAVAETFGRGGKFKTPVVESTGTGGGIKQFCAGVGVGHPDLTNASRRIKKSELEGCAANGVTAVSERRGRLAIRFERSSGGPFRASCARSGRWLAAANSPSRCRRGRPPASVRLCAGRTVTRSA